MRNIENKEICVRPNDKGWYNGHLRKLIRVEKRAHKNAKLRNNELSWRNFWTKRNYYINECIKYKGSYYNEWYSKLIELAKDNPKKWWRLMKECLGNNDIVTSIPPIVDDETKE